MQNFQSLISKINLNKKKLLALLFFIISYVQCTQAQRCFENKANEQQLICQEVGNFSAILTWMRPIYTDLLIEFENPLTFSFRAADLHEAFANVKNLQFQNVDVISFGFGLKSFKSLTKLNITHANIEFFPFTYLPEDNSIEVLDASRNHLRGSPAPILQRLPKLKIAQLSHNNLNEEEHESLPESRLLRYLDLSHNNFTRVKVRYFYGLQNLEFVSLAHNKIEKLELPALHGLKKVKVLDLSYNRIRSFRPEDIFGLEKIESLNLANNGIGWLVSWQFESVKTLKNLDLSGNQMIEIGRNSFAGLTEVITLSLDNNLLNTLSGDIFNPMLSLEVLNLSGNELQTFPDNVFGENNFGKIREITLDNNGMTSVHPQAFSNLSNLQSISLTNNHLTTIDFNLFVELPRLETLTLDRNRLSEFNINSLNALVKLSITFNRFTFFPMITNEMPSLEKLALEGNPWHCPCFEELLDALHKRNISYMKSNSLYFQGAKPLCVVINRSFCINDIENAKDLGIADKFDRYLQNN